MVSAPARSLSFKATVTEIVLSLTAPRSTAGEAASTADAPIIPSAAAAMPVLNIDNLISRLLHGVSLVLTTSVRLGIFGAVLRLQRTLILFSARGGWRSGEDWYYVQKPS